MLLLALGLGFLPNCRSVETPAAIEEKAVPDSGRRSSLEQEVDKLGVFTVIQDTGMAVFYTKREAVGYLKREDGTYTGTLAHFDNRQAVLDYTRQRRAGNRPKIDDGHRYLEGCKPSDIFHFQKVWEEMDKKIEKWKKAGVWNLPYFITFEGQERSLSKE